MSMPAGLHNLVQRVKIAASIVKGRTLVQYTGLDEDTRDRVELLLPYGYVANPVAGSDALEVQIGAYGSHKIVLGGDNTADALADLQPGEAGLSRNGQQLVLRLTGIEVVTPLLKWGATRSALLRLVQEDFLSLFNSHVHNVPGGGTTSPPTSSMTAAHLTGGS